MKKKIIVAFFILFLGGGWPFGVAKADSINSSGAANSSGIFTMPTQGYFQNSTDQQQASNINAAVSGLNQLQPIPNTTLTVDSPVITANNSNSTTKNSGVLIFFVVIAVFSLLAVIVYIFSVAEQEVKEAKLDEDIKPVVVKKLKILDEAPVALVKEKETPTKPKKATKKKRDKHGRPAKKQKNKK